MGRLGELTAVGMSSKDTEISSFFSSCGGILELRRGSQPSPWVGPGKPNLPLGLRGKAGGGARVTAGPKRPHLSVCPGPNFPLQGRQGSRGCIPGSPGEAEGARWMESRLLLMSQCACPVGKFRIYLFGSIVL